MANLSTESLEALQSAKYLQVASFALIFWEYFITVDTEVHLFWNGPLAWSKTRLLFFVNRYLILLVVCIELPSSLLSASQFVQACSASLALETINIIVIHAIHGLRLWHLFSHNVCIRVFVLLALISSTAGILVIARDYVSAFLAKHTCLLPPSTSVLRIYWIPAFTLHSLFYALTVFRAFRYRSTSSNGSAIMKHLVAEGGMFMLLVTVSAMFTAIGANSDNYRIFIAATVPQFVTPVLSAAMSRLILRLGSLADDLATEPEWLLSHLELSRVHWRRGAHERELIVEVNPVTVDEHELSSRLL